MLEYEKLSAALFEAAQSGTAVSGLQAQGLDEVCAYGVQDQLAARYERQGYGVVGWKAALTASALLEKFQRTEPVYGRIWSAACFASGKELSIPRDGVVKVEGEMAFVLARDIVAPPRDRAELLRWVDYALPAMEIVCSRYEGSVADAAAIIADNASFMAAVLGDVPVDPAGLETDLVGMRLEVNGRLRATGVSAAVLGDPLNSLEWLIRKLLSQGKSLRRGEVVLAGALAPAEEARPGDCFQAEFDGLGRVCALFS